MYGVYNGTSPSYIADATTKISTLSGRGQLETANTSKFDIPHTRTKLEEREHSLWQVHDNGMLCQPW